MGNLEWVLLQINKSGIRVYCRSINLESEFTAIGESERVHRNRRRNLEKKMLHTSRVPLILSLVQVVIQGWHLYLEILALADVQDQLLPGNENWHGAGNFPTWIDRMYFLLKNGIVHPVMLLLFAGESLVVGPEARRKWGWILQPQNCLLHLAALVHRISLQVLPMTQDAVWEGLSPGCLAQSRYETKGFGDRQVRLDLSGADPCLHLRGWVHHGDRFEVQGSGNVKQPLPNSRTHSLTPWLK